MRSPFPGMDPWLETRWPGVHVGLIAYTQEALQPLLPGDLRARAEERVLLETLDGESLGSYRPDVAVVRTQREASPRNVPPGTSTVEPVVVDLHSLPVMDRFVKIIDVSRGERVVTAIEVLSPWNKGPGPLNTDYRRKLDDYARGAVNVVEIDLLRSSRGRLEVGQQDLPLDRRAPYLTCVRRAAVPSRWEVYPMDLRSPLPAVPIPLREGEDDVVLDLQALIARVYAAGGHDDIDYRTPPDPPLVPDDAGWADALLHAAGRR